MTTINQLFLRQDANIIEAMKILELYPQKIILIVSDDMSLLGTVTDGDIRRGLIRQISLQDRVELIMNKNPVTASIQETTQSLEKLIKRKKISQIPLLNEAGKVVDLFLAEDFQNLIEKPNTVVIMAGGLGSRMGELTTDCPKPMLKLGDKPLLEMIIESFKQHGFKRFILSVNYKAEIIENYFKSGEDWDVQISYIKEKFRMGTAGSLTLISEKLQQSFIVMNADVLTKVNFSEFLNAHEKSKKMATMCVRNYENQIPFGVIHLAEQSIDRIEEKPISSYLVNAGIYALSPEVLSLIPKDTYFDMPSLFNLLLSQDKKQTGVFPIHEYWLDIGRRDDFNKAQNDVKNYES
jgi:dTDP-glucose pyrophosphorylase